MKRGFLLFFVCLCSSIFAGIEGEYKVTGRDPYKNESYTGTCTITKGKNDVLQAYWSFDDGDQFSGTGLLSDECVSFIFFHEQNEGLRGLQVYKVNGSTLNGTWVLEGKDLLGTEKMERT